MKRTMNQINNKYKELEVESLINRYFTLDVYDEEDRESYSKKIRKIIDVMSDSSNPKCQKIRDIYSQINYINDVHEEEYLYIDLRFNENNNGKCRSRREHIELMTASEVIEDIITLLYADINNVLNIIWIEIYSSCNGEFVDEYMLTYDINSKYEIEEE